MISDDGISAYERQRLENIRRNEDMLRKLGLHVESFSTAVAGYNRGGHPTSGKSSSRPQKKKTPKKRGGGAYLKQPQDRSQGGGSRRSLRLLGIKAKPQSEADVALLDSLDGEVDEDGSNHSKKRYRPQQQQHYSHLNKKKKTAKEPKPRPPPAKDSSRALDVDLDNLQQNYLGKPCGRLKREVVSVLHPQSMHVRFSKYSGILEWKNAIVLWVNIYGDSYKNLFLENGRQLTWFGQSRQTEETPVIRKMIPSTPPSLDEGSCRTKVAKEEGKQEGGKMLPVLLLCRLEGGDYIYCGRLKYLAHDPTKLPLRFVWELASHQQLTKKNKIKREKGNDDTDDDDDDDTGTSGDDYFMGLVRESEAIAGSLYSKNVQ